MNQITLKNGKTVTFRTRFPAKEFHTVPRLWEQSVEAEATLEQKMQIAALFIEHWDYPDAVSDLQTWETMDTFEEVQPILRWINRFVIDKAADIKNSASGPGSL